jgi:hypothetical protein
MHGSESYRGPEGPLQPLDGDRPIALHSGGPEGPLTEESEGCIAEDDLVVSRQPEGQKNVEVVTTIVEVEPQTRELAGEATQFLPTGERPPASSAC